MPQPFFTVYIPTYNNSSTIIDTLNSLIHQTFKDFDIVIRDDGSKDNTLDLVKQSKDQRLTIFANPKNLGYSGNLNAGLKDCHGKYLFLLAGDDLLDCNALKWYHQALKRYPQAGAITRPYYWFDTDYRQPVRLKKTIASQTDLLVKIDGPFKHVLEIFSTIDQLSALCLRRDFIDIEFSPEPWIAHAYPFLSIFKHHPIIFIKKYPLAVRIGHSATRSNIYQKSPMYSWKNMMDQVFTEKKLLPLKNNIISEFIATNYIGLIQIRNYGTFYYYLREVKNLITFRPKNLLSPNFWLIFFITLITPPFLLRPLTDKYKSVLYSKLIASDIVIRL